MKPSVKICVNLWLVAALLLVPALPADAARRPKRQEVAPEIKAQVLERQLAETDVSPAERARLAVALAENYYQLKDFEREAEVLEDVLAVGITDTNLAAEAHYYLGRTYQTLGSHDQAADHFEIVWQQYPGSHFRFHAAMELGDLMLLAGDNEAATEWYQAIIAAQPRAKLAFLARDKLSAIASNLTVQAITDESQRPVHVKDQLHKLDRFLYSQMYTDADAVAQQLIVSRTNAALRAAMNFHVAKRYWLFGNAEGAANFLPEALSTSGSRHVEALILAGHIKRAMGEDDVALGYYQQAISTAPAEPMTITAYQQATRLLVRQGRQTEALALDDQGKQAYTGTDKLPAYLDRISNTLRDRALPQWRDYAMQVAATATNEFGRRALMQLASEARLQMDWPRAEQYYQQLAAHPSAYWRSTVDMQVRLLESQLQQSNLVAAAATEQSLLQSSALLSTDGQKAYVRYRLGKCWLANGDSAKAETRWQDTISQYPNTMMARMARIQLARLYESRGDLPGAVAQYEAYLQHPTRVRVFKLHAYARLVSLRQQLGQDALAAQDAAAAQALADASNDAELQLNLAQHYLRHGNETRGRELLERGLANADAHVRKLADPTKKLWWEYLMARRLQDFDEHERLGTRLQSCEQELLQNPALDVGMRHSAYYILIRALENCGHQADAETMCQRVIQTIPEDSDRMGHILYRLSQQAKVCGDKVKVCQLAEAAFSELPTGSLAQHMYLASAAEDFNAGRVQDAQAKVTRLEEAVPLSRQKGAAEDFRWEAQYLKGRCLTACGNPTEGQRLVAEALAKYPAMPMPHVLQFLSNTGH